MTINKAHQLHQFKLFLSMNTITHSHSSVFLPKWSSKFPKTFVSPLMHHIHVSHPTSSKHQHLPSSKCDPPQVSKPRQHQAALPLTAYQGDNTMILEKRFEGFNCDFRTTGGTFEDPPDDFRLNYISFCFFEDPLLCV